MRGLAFLVAAAVFSGCHSDPDCAGPVAPLDAAAYGPESAAVAAADGFILGELAAARASGGLRSARLDASAKSLGFSGAAELAALSSRGCAAPADVSRFAAARGLRAETAGNYLRLRFGVAACAD